MSAFELFATLMLLIVALTILLILRKLRRIEERIAAFAKSISESSDSSIHDTLHPVFSAKQVRQSRDRFEHHYKTRWRLERRIRQSEHWPQTTPVVGELSADLQREMREICEEIVESECWWREYVFMIAGNLNVASRGESSLSVVDAWQTLLKETRGVAARDFVAPNRTKLKRADQWFDSWSARLRGEPYDREPEEDLFKDMWESRDEWRARDKFESFNENG